jgi:hypothetical protein
MAQLIYYPGKSPAFADHHRTSSFLAVVRQWSSVSRIGVSEAELVDPMFILDLFVRFDGFCCHAETEDVHTDLNKVFIAIGSKLFGQAHTHPLI